MVKEQNCNKKIWKTSQLSELTLLISWMFKNTEKIHWVFQP